MAPPMESEDINYLQSVQSLKARFWTLCSSDEFEYLGDML